MMYRSFAAQSDFAQQTRSWGWRVNQAVSPWAGPPFRDQANWWSAGARMMMRAGLTFARPD